jgi:hypothetical protein
MNVHTLQYSIERHILLSVIVNSEAMLLQMVLHCVRTLCNGITRVISVCSMTHAITASSGVAVLHST